MTNEDQQKAESIVDWYAGNEISGGQLATAIATALTETRAETWKAAIEIAKQPINTWGWGSASGGIAQKVIVDQLEAAIRAAAGDEK